MDNPKFTNLVLGKKQDKVILTIYLACKYCNLTVPIINFDGCPLEGANGPELAHYHTDGSKICISRRQLNLQNMNGLEETSIHEVIHHLGLRHGSAQEKVKFERIKNYVRSRVWLPPNGVVVVRGEDSNERNTESKTEPRMRGNANDFAQNDVARDYESELRILISQLEDAKSNDERKWILDEIAKVRKRIGHKVEIKSEEKKAIDKLNVEEKKIVNRILTGNPYSDKEWEAIIREVYEGQDYGFGDQHGQNRWTMKKKGLLDKLKEKLGSFL
jgi:hypothetical protein